MFAKLKALPGKAKDSIDVFMENRMGFSPRQRHLKWHYARGLMDQIMAIIPISVFQVYKSMQLKIKDPRFVLFGENP